MIRPLKYIILGVGIGLIAASFFVDNHKIVFEGNTQPKYAINGTVQEQDTTGETANTHQTGKIRTGEGCNTEDKEEDKSGSNSGSPGGDKEQSGGVETETNDVSGVETADDSNKAIEVEISIPDGVNSYRVGVILSENGLIADPAGFEEYIIEKGKDKTIKPGKYLINTDMSMDDIIEIITSGEEK